MLPPEVSPVDRQGEGREAGFRRMIVTKHARVRLEQRFDIKNSDDIRQLVQKATERGLIWANEKEEYLVYRNFVFVCRRRGNNIIVVTVLNSSNGLSNRCCHQIVDATLVPNRRINTIIVPLVNGCVDDFIETNPSKRG